MSYVDAKEGARARLVTGCVIVQSSGFEARDAAT